ncbi:MAG: sialate O-acetylesterase [Myxococcota bacterium]
MRFRLPAHRSTWTLLAGVFAWAACSGDANDGTTDDTVGVETPAVPGPNDTATDDTGSDDTAAADTGLDVPEPDVVQVFLLAGQSNMAGRASSAELPVQLGLEQPDVRLLYSGGGSHPPDTLVPLQPGSGSGFGPEVSFGRAVADLTPDADVVLIKHAVGGTNLFDDWDPSTGPEYQELRRTVADGLQALVDEGLTAEIRGFAWLQGEADVVQGRSQAEYTSDLIELIDAVRTDFAGGDDLRFVIGRLSDRQFEGDGDLEPGREAIQAAQDEVGGKTTNVAVVDTDRLRLQDDRHYDAPSQVAMGTLLARALLEAPQASNIARFDFGRTGQPLAAEEPGWTPLQLQQFGRPGAVSVVDPATGWTITVQPNGVDLIGRDRSPLAATVASAFTLEAVYTDFVTAWESLTIRGLDASRTYDVQVPMFDDDATQVRTQTLTQVGAGTDVELGETDGPGPGPDPELTDDLVFSIVGRGLTPESDGSLTFVCSNSVTVDRCLANGLVISEN